MARGNIIDINEERARLSGLTAAPQETAIAINDNLRHAFKTAGQEPIPQKFHNLIERLRQMESPSND